MVAGGGEGGTLSPMSLSLLLCEMLFCASCIPSITEDRVPSLSNPLTVNAQ